MEGQCPGIYCKTLLAGIMKKNIKFKCPVCRKEIVYSTQNPSRPFCSERCRLVDLGQWLDGDYKIIDDEACEENYNLNEQ